MRPILGTYSLGICRLVLILAQNSHTVNNFLNVDSFVDCGKFWIWKWVLFTRKRNIWGKKVLLCIHYLMEGLGSWIALHMSHRQKSKTLNVTYHTAKELQATVCMSYITLTKYKKHVTCNIAIEWKAKVCMAYNITHKEQTAQNLEKGLAISAVIQNTAKTTSVEYSANCADHLEKSKTVTYYRLPLSRSKEKWFLLETNDFHSGCTEVRLRTLTEVVWIIFRSSGPCFTTGVQFLLCGTINSNEGLPGQLQGNPAHNEESN